ncbi:MAG: arginase family protein [Hyphomicrobiaceae bacterium]
MDKTKLRVLRAHMPMRRAATSTILNSRWRRQPCSRHRTGGGGRFSGVATFLGAPFLPDTADQGFKDLDVALIGVPMDLGVTNRAGARLGPRAVRAIERIGPYEHALGIAPMAHVRVGDVGDVAMQSRFDLAACHGDIEAWYATCRDRRHSVISRRRPFDQPARSRLLAPRPPVGSGAHRCSPRPRFRCL